MQAGLAKWSIQGLIGFALLSLQLVHVVTEIVFENRLDQALELKIFKFDLKFVSQKYS